MLAINDDVARAALRRMQAREGGKIIGNQLIPIGPFLSALRPLEPTSPKFRRWHVVQCQPQQEGRVEDGLRELRLDAYNPQITRKIRVNIVRHRIVKRPMLVGYVLAGFDVDREFWERIISMRGVIRLLCVGERPVPILDEMVQHLRVKEIEESGGKAAKGPPIKLEQGVIVRILEPMSFAGLFGKIVAVDQEKRAVGVDIDMFGQAVELTLEPEQVEAL